MACNGGRPAFLEMEIHLGADEGPFIIRIGNLFLFRVECFPFDVLPRHVFIPQNPAFTAGTAIVEQGTPFVIASDGAIGSIAIPAGIGLPGPWFLEIRITIVQAQERTVTLVIGVGLDLVSQEAYFLGKVEPAAEDVGFIIINGFFTP